MSQYRISKGLQANLHLSSVDYKILRGLIRELSRGENCLDVNGSLNQYMKMYGFRFPITQVNAGDFCTDSALTE